MGILIALHPCQYLLLSVFLILSILVGMKVVSRCGLLYIFLQHIGDLCIFFCELSKYLPVFGGSVVLFLICKNSLYILDRSLCQMYLLPILFPVCGLFVHFIYRALMMSFDEQIFISVKFILPVFSFMASGFCFPI